MRQKFPVLGPCRVGPANAAPYHGDCGFKAGRVHEEISADYDMIYAATREKIHAGRLDEIVEHARQALVLSPPMAFTASKSS